MPFQSHIQTWLPALVLLALSACDASSIPVEPYEREVGETTRPVTYDMVTHTEVSVVAPGQPLEVLCMLRQGADFYHPAGDARLVVTPATGDIAPGGNRPTFTPSQAGSYHIACQSADGALTDPVGVDISVTGAPPASWTVSQPDALCFSQIDRLEIDYQVFDSNGAPMLVGTDPLVEISPAQGWIGNLTTGFRFLEDGVYQVTVRWPGKVAAGGALDPVSFAVTVDATAPVITFTSPQAGAVLSTGGYQDTPVTVTGRVVDPNTALTSVVVNGVSQAINGTDEASFAVQMNSRWGLSVASVTATDTCGNVGYAALPFLRSPTSYPATTTPTAGSRIQNAVTAQLSQTVVDDGDRADLDDLASLGQAILDNYDINTLLPPGGELGRKNLRTDCDGTFGTTFVDVGYLAQRHPSSSKGLTVGVELGGLVFYDGALGFDIEINNVNVPLRFTVGVLQCTLGAPKYDEITVDASVGFSRLAAGGLLGADVNAGSVSTSMQSFEFAAQGLYLNANCGAMDWACDSVSDAVMGAAETLLGLVVEDAVTAMVPPLLSDTLNNLDVTKYLSIPAPVNMSLVMQAQLESLTFCGPSVGLGAPAGCGTAQRQPGAMALNLSGQILPSFRHSSIPVGAPGPVAFPANPPSFHSGNTSFGAGIKLDLLNQALWAAWYGGAFNRPSLRDVVAVLPEGIEGSVQALLPPVVMPGRDGTALDVGLGGVRVQASVNVTPLLGSPEGEPYYVEADLSLSLIVGASVKTDKQGKHVSILLDPAPEMFIQVHSVNDFAYANLLGHELGKLLTTSLSDLLGDVAEGIEIPAFDLSGVAGLPEGTVLSLTGASASVQDGYLVLMGRVE